ncbi:MAG: hypothetical protein K0B02_03280 [DPANN group archaeon]|nr:hypothetical protein [DPANN group archaeon]
MTPSTYLDIVDTYSSKYVDSYNFSAGVKAFKLEYNKSKIYSDLFGKPQLKLDYDDLKNILFISSNSEEYLDNFIDCIPESVKINVIPKSMSSLFLGINKRLENLSSVSNDILNSNINLNPLLNDSDISEISKLYDTLLHFIDFSLSKKLLVHEQEYVRDVSNELEKELLKTMTNQKEILSSYNNSVESLTAIERMSMLGL